MAPPLQYVHTPRTALTRLWAQPGVPPAVVGHLHVSGAARPRPIRGECTALRRTYVLVHLKNKI